MHDNACPVGCQARESKTGAKLLCTAIREIELQEKPGEKSSYQRNGRNERGRTRFEKRRMVQRGMKAAFIEQEMHREANSSESGNPERRRTRASEGGSPCTCPGRLRLVLFGDHWGVGAVHARATRSSPLQYCSSHLGASRIYSTAVSCSPECSSGL